MTRYSPYQQLSAMRRALIDLAEAHPLKQIVMPRDEAQRFIDWMDMVAASCCGNEERLAEYEKAEAEAVRRAVVEEAAAANVVILADFKKKPRSGGGNGAA